MSEQEKNQNPAQSTEEKMQELFDLLNEKAASGELVETEEDVSTKQPEVDTSPMSESETAAFEYNMMMQQYEAMLLDWQRREAEEQAQKKAEEEKDQEEKDGRYIRRERYAGSCSRTFYVGNLNPSDIKCKYESGVLQLTVPKMDREALKAQNRIAIE